MNKIPYFILGIIFTLYLNTNAQVNLQPNFTDELVMGGWNQANGIVYDSTGQAYVWELKGKIWVIDTNGSKLNTTLLNISDEVGNWRGHGLHGVCLDPNFRTNGYFYCYYAVDRYYLMNYGKTGYNINSNQYYNASILRVARFTADINTNFTTLVPNSKLILIGETQKTGIPLLHVTHDGGTILFGKDGSLLVFTGDGADYGQVDNGSAPGTYWSQALTDTIIRNAENVGSFRSQLLNSHNGKILRINPANGDGLPSNPYYNSNAPRSAQSRAYALGLRQPYRCNIKPGTGSTDINTGNPGTLIVSEVGWSTWEGVWFVDQPGKNLGWPIFEGLHRTVGYQSSVNNKDAPNPLNGTNGCNKPYFTFQNLLVNSTSTNPSFPNPCDNNIQIPASTFKYKWLAPIINYRHAIDQTEVPLIIGDSITPISVSDSSANVSGSTFSGNTSMAGPWYTGQNFPTTYQNTYFNFDYGSQWIKNFKLDSNNKVIEVRPFAENLGEIVYLTLNQKDGCLYYLKLEGELRKICYNHSNDAPPVAFISLDKTYSATNSINLNFSGANSFDPEGGSLTYLWDFGDSITYSNASGNITLSTTDTSPKSITISLTVTDQVNKSNTDSVQVYLNNFPPIVKITSVHDSDFYSIGEPQVVNLIANVIDNAHDSTLTYNWQAILFHDEHNHPEPVEQDHISYTTLSNDGCGGELFWWEINLSVIDAQGLKGSDKVRLYPDCKLPEAKIISPDTACKGSAVTFTDNSYNAAGISWIFENGIPSTSIEKNPKVTYATNGFYKVMLIAQNVLGVDTAIKFITIGTNNMSLAVTYTPNDTICNGDSLQLGVTGAINASAYQWFNGKNAILNSTNQKAVVKVGGTYKVMVSDTYGCTKFSNIQKITMLTGKATATSNGSTNICIGDSVQLSVNSNFNKSYQWTRNSVNINGANAQNYFAKTAGTYKCTVTNSFGCAVTSDHAKVKLTCKVDEGFEKNGSTTVSIFPNPVVSNLNIYFDVENDNPIYFVILDVLGREVMRTNPVSYEYGSQQITVDAGQLKNGLYLLQMKSSTATETVSFQIVNQK